VFRRIYLFFSSYLHDIFKTQLNAQIFFQHYLSATQVHGLFLIRSKRALAFYLSLDGCLAWYDNPKWYIKGSRFSPPIGN